MSGENIVCTRSVFRADLEDVERQIELQVETVRECKLKLRHDPSSLLECASSVSEAAACGTEVPPDTITVAVPLETLAEMQALRKPPPIVRSLVSAVRCVIRAEAQDLQSSTWEHLQRWLLDFDVGSALEHFAASRVTTPLRNALVSFLEFEGVTRDRVQRATALAVPLYDWLMAALAEPSELSGRASFACEWPVENHGATQSVDEDAIAALQAAEARLAALRGEARRLQAQVLYLEQNRSTRLCTSHTAALGSLRSAENAKVVGEQDQPQRDVVPVAASDNEGQGASSEDDEECESSAWENLQVPVLKQSVQFTRGSSEISEAQAVVLRGIEAVASRPTTTVVFVGYQEEAIEDPGLDVARAKAVASACFGKNGAVVESRVRAFGGGAIAGRGHRYVTAKVLLDVALPTIAFENLSRGMRPDAATRRSLRALARFLLGTRGSHLALLVEGGIDEGAELDAADGSLQRRREIKLRLRNLSRLGRFLMALRWQVRQVGCGPMRRECLTWMTRRR
eukprot:TRINITY_DN14713_c0_g1_i1.p1 TRINITY_DN14713_c0_g1~~TRINITY_DN14713_c0_g1_i1.p1  ORF type:complete len:513 (-),score=70.84 TRINITY_DN14713_c0_g1_i1:59-1597(-)